MKTKALVPINGVDLSVLNIPKRDYICYRIYGLTAQEAIKLTGRKAYSLNDWRFDDPNFKAIESYVENNGHELYGECGAVIDGILQAGILKQAIKITDLDDKERSKEEIALIKWAIDLWFKRRGTVKEEGSYDELVLKSHRRLK